jgi:hypothetical protein
MAANSFYTPEEDEIIRLHYPAASQAEIAQMLPHRTPRGISVRANKIGVHKNKECWEVGIPFSGSVIGHLTEAEKGYLAGIIDGEGCILMNREKGRKGEYIYRLSVTIANSSKNLHGWLEEKLVGRGYVRRVKPTKDRVGHPERWKPMYNWVVSGSRKAIVLLREIAPYLVIKREQAELLVNGYVHLSEGQRNELYLKLRQLKKTS